MGQKNHVYKMDMQPCLHHMRCFDSLLYIALYQHSTQLHRLQYFIQWVQNHKATPAAPTSCPISSPWDPSLGQSLRPRPRYPSSRRAGLRPRSAKPTSRVPRTWRKDCLHQRCLRLTAMLPSLVPIALAMPARSGWSFCFPVLPCSPHWPAVSIFHQRKILQMYVRHTCQPKRKRWIQY